MFCPNCGKEFDKGACPYCGYDMTQQFQQFQQGQQNQQFQQPFFQQTPVQQPKKKKHGCLSTFVLIFAVFICFIVLASKSSNSSDNSKKTIASVETESGTSKSIELEDDDDDEPEKTQANVSVDEQVIWETDNIKITATGIDQDSDFGAEINLLVENNSDKDIRIGTDEVIVNGYMINDLTSIKCTAGNKANDSITLFSSELSAAGIDTIGQIELYLHIYDADSYEKIASSDCITIKTSAYDSMDTETNISGTVLYDANNVKIVAQYVDEDSYWGSAVLLYMENNSNENITIRCEDTSVNGFMVDSYMSEHIYAGKKCISDATLWQSSLDENGITDIETIQMTFSITNDDYHEIANSGKVTLNLN